MIVHKCIEIHSRDYEWWIIVIEFRVLLITYNLVREKLVETVLNIHIRGVRIKNLSIHALMINAIFLLWYMFYNEIIDIMKILGDYN